MSSEPATLTAAVAAHLLDAPLAATTWLLVERGVPLLAAGADGAAREALLDAIVGALPAARRPEPADGGPGRLVRVAGVISAAAPAGMLRAALAATTGRGGLAATVDAPDLEGVLGALARQGLTSDEASFLGCVVVLGSTGLAGRADAGARVVAAHYLRPLARDAGGHQRRLGPAVLATWDAAADAWEDFSWAILPDLAERCRMRPGELEAERSARAEIIDTLVRHGRTDAASLAASVAHLAHVRPQPG